MTKPTPRRLSIHALECMDIRRAPNGYLPMEGLILSLVDDEDGYSLDMLRVTLRAGSDGAMQYRTYTPEQGVDEKAVAARNLADRVGPALGLAFAASVSDERERASLVYTALVVETVRVERPKPQPQVAVLFEAADAVSGAALFSEAVAQMFEDRRYIDTYFAGRSAA